MRKFLALFLLFFPMVILACSGCGSSDGGGGDGALVSVAISADGLSGGTLAAPKGKAVALALVGSTASGGSAAVDSSAVTWTVDGPAFSVNGGTLTANQDWFDGPNATPRGTLTASYGGKTATVTLVGVIDAEGSWTATLDTGTSLNLHLTQSGSTVTDTGTHISGAIDGDSLSFDASGFRIDAKFVSRTEADGTYAGSGLHGTLVCKRSP